MSSAHRAIGGIGRGAPVAAVAATAPGGILDVVGGGFGNDQTNFPNGSCKVGFGRSNDASGFGGGGFGNNQAGGRSGDGCRNCGESGHFARECPNDRRKKGCFKYGVEGHMAKDCTASQENTSGGGGGFGGSGFGSGSVFRGGAIDENAGVGFGASGGGRGPRTCNKCGKEGHIARSCPGDGGTGGGGGFASAGSGGGGGFASAGFGGGDDQESRPRGKGCHNCGEEGHFSRECTQPRKQRDRGTRSGEGGGFSGAGFDSGDGFGGGNEGGGRSRACYNCGGDGHMSKDCPEPRKERPPAKCYRCNQEGHISKDCTNPPVEGYEERKPAQIYVPEEPSVDKLWEEHIAAGIKFDRYFNIPVEVSGNDTAGVRAVRAFAEADLTPMLLSNLEKAGYGKPTPIQQFALPFILRGRDVMACAQTGSGKTAAFLLPMINSLLKSGAEMASAGEKQDPAIVVILPTRELALQIRDEARKFSSNTPVKVVVLYGGTSVGHQMGQLQEGCDLLVATPGRFLGLVGKSIIGLAKCKYLVLDEADRMLDMGFAPEIRKLINDYDMLPKAERQTLMFSATFPHDVQEMALEFLNDHVFITIGKVGAANDDIKQNVLRVSQYEKKDKLTDLITTDMESFKNEDGSFYKKTLVFVERKRVADFVASYLSQSGVPATSIHGDREQYEREIAMSDFKSGRCPVLVATSVAARGLDIKGVDHVINHDLPQSIDDYVNRIGRTGRIGNPGRATSFFDPDTDSELAQDLLKILSDAQQEVPEWFLEYCKSSSGGEAAGFGNDEGQANDDVAQPSVKAEANW